MSFRQTEPVKLSPSMHRRPRHEAYTPPARRGTPSTQRAPRTLEDAAGSPYVQVVSRRRVMVLWLGVFQEQPPVSSTLPQVVVAGMLPLDGCPFEVLDTVEGDSTLQVPNLVDCREELLDWFGAASGSMQDPASLRLPCTLSKKERAEWHRTAQQRDLATESQVTLLRPALLHRHRLHSALLNAHMNGAAALRAQGLGDQRHLLVISSAPRGGGGDGESARVSPAQRKEAKRIWGWCQSEGGAFWGNSQNEIAAMLATDALTPDLVALCERRCGLTSGVDGCDSSCRVEVAQLRLALPASRCPLCGHAHICPRKHAMDYEH